MINQDKAGKMLNSRVMSIFNQPINYHELTLSYLGEWEKRLGYAIDKDISSTYYTTTYMNTFLSYNGLNRLLSEWDVVNEYFSLYADKTKENINFNGILTATRGLPFIDQMAMESPAPGRLNVIYRFNKTLTTLEEQNLVNVMVGNSAIGTYFDGAVSKIYTSPVWNQEFTVKWDVCVDKNVTIRLKYKRNTEEALSYSPLSDLQDKLKTTVDTLMTGIGKSVNYTYLAGLAVDISGIDVSNVEITPEGEPPIMNADYNTPYNQFNVYTLIVEEEF